MARSRSGGEEVERLSHDHARHVVDDEVRGAGDDLGVDPRPAFELVVRAALV
jgi:hypothetical protein